MTNNKVDLREVMGHMVDLKIKHSYNENIVSNMGEGRIIYSDYHDALFFKPKGNRNRGYSIDEEDIISAEIVRKDNKQHELNVDQYYNHREEAQQKREERIQRERETSEARRTQQREDYKKRQREKAEAEQKRIDEAKQLGGYDELSKEVIDFYNETYGEDHYSESYVNGTVIPLLNNLIHKTVNNVNSYPKYYFCKKSNPTFCKLIEKYSDIKLGNTQKGNVEILNKYLTA